VQFVFHDSVPCGKETACAISKIELRVSLCRRERQTNLLVDPREWFIIAEIEPFATNRLTGAMHVEPLDEQGESLRGVEFLFIISDLQEAIA
jgi:hypothetical protein